MGFRPVDDSQTGGVLGARAKRYQREVVADLEVRLRDLRYGLDHGDDLLGWVNGHPIYRSRLWWWCRKGGKGFMDYRPR